MWSQQPEPLTTPGIGETWHGLPQSLPDGKGVLFTILTPEGTRVETELREDLGRYRFPRLSPDGRRVAVLRIMEGGGTGRKTDIWILDLDRDTQTRCPLYSLSMRARLRASLSWRLHRSSRRTSTRPGKGDRPRNRTPETQAPRNRTPETQAPRAPGCRRPPPRTRADARAGETRARSLSPSSVGRPSQFQSL